MAADLPSLDGTHFSVGYKVQMACEIVIEEGRPQIGEVSVFGETLEQDTEASVLVIRGSEESARGHADIIEAPPHLVVRRGSPLEDALLAAAADHDWPAWRFR